MTTQQAVLYVQRNGFYYQDDGKNSSTLRYNFLPSVVLDLDILDAKAFAESIKAFIVNNKLSAKECIIVISESVYFEKDYIGITKEQEQPVTQLFVDSVPFENVLTKTYLIENGIKVVVANKDFCLGIKNACDANGLAVAAITPAVIVGARESDDITATFALFFEKYEFLKQNKFLLLNSVPTKKTPLVQNVQPGATPKQSYKRTIILVIVFLLLIFILIAMLLSNNS